MPQTFRDRRYLASLGVLAIVLVTALLAGHRSTTNAQPAGGRQTVPATQTAVPTPSRDRTPGADELLLDSKRALDLKKIAAALATLHDATGAYPSTFDAFSIICATPQSTACALSALAGTVPSGDGQSPYWYRSDGRSYTLFTRTSSLPNSACPADLPPPLLGSPVYCVAAVAQGGGR